MVIIVTEFNMIITVNDLRIQHGYYSTNSELSMVIKVTLEFSMVMTANKPRHVAVG